MNNPEFRASPEVRFEWLGDLTGRIFDRVRQRAFAEARRRNVTIKNTSAISINLKFTPENNTEEARYELEMRQDLDGNLHVRFHNSDSSQYANYTAISNGDAYEVRDNPYIANITQEDVVAMLGKVDLDLGGEHNSEKGINPGPDGIFHFNQETD